MTNGSCRGKPIAPRVRPPRLIRNRRTVHAVTESKGATRLMWVWDLPTRLFHWLLVGAVLVAFVTEFIAPVWWLSWHVAAGYTLAALLLFRLSGRCSDPNTAASSAFSTGRGRWPTICALS